MQNQTRINLGTCSVVVLLGAGLLLLGGWNLYSFFINPKSVLSAEIIFAGVVPVLLGTSIVYGGLFLMKAGLKQRKSPQT